MADYFYPYHYPTLKHEALSSNMVRINLVDQTGQVLAWWDEEAGQESQQFDPFSIYACNLDLRTSKDEIFSHFCSLGEIMRITYLKNKKNNSFNGSIYVQFKTIQAAEEALFLDGSYLRGKLIYVKKKLQTMAQTVAVQTKKKEVEDSLQIKQEQSDVDDCSYDPLSIFISNLKWDINESHLAGHFGSVGDIAKVTVLRDKMTGFSRGSAYLQFYQARSVGRALELTNTYIRDSFIIVQRKKIPKTNNQQLDITENNNLNIKTEAGLTEDEQDSIYVGNLDWKVDKDSLAEIFKNAGNIKRLTINKNKMSAYIQFQENDSVKDALVMDGFSLHGREMRIQRKRKLSL